MEVTRSTSNKKHFTLWWVDESRNGSGCSENGGHVIERCDIFIPIVPPDFSHKIDFGNLFKLTHNFQTALKKARKEYLGQKIGDRHFSCLLCFDGIVPVVVKPWPTIDILRGVDVVYQALKQMAEELLFLYDAERADCCSVACVDLIAKAKQKADLAVIVVEGVYVNLEKPIPEYVSHFNAAKVTVNTREFLRNHPKFSIKTLLCGHQDISLRDEILLTETCSASEIVFQEVACLYKHYGEHNPFRNC